MTDNINYSLFLTTSGDGFAGTDEDIYIQLVVEDNGVTTAKTVPAYIDDPNTDDFEKSSAKRYSFSGAPIDYTHVYLALFPVGVKPKGDLWEGISNPPAETHSIWTFKSSDANVSEEEKKTKWKQVNLNSYQNGDGMFPSTMSAGAPSYGLDERNPSWKLDMFNLSGSYKENFLRSDNPEFLTNQWLTRGTVLKVARHKFNTRPAAQAAE